MDSNSSHRTSNRERRLQSDKRERITDGIEDWNHTRLEPRKISVLNDSSLRLSESSRSSKQERTQRYDPVSLILSIQDNILLNKDNEYEVKFSTAILEGSAISIDARGTAMTFKNPGSYKFEMCGEASSNAEVTLIYDSNKFTHDIKQLSITRIPKEESRRGKVQIRGVPTILPLERGQVITVKIVSSIGEPIILSSGTRLLIHRVA